MRHSLGRWSFGLLSLVAFACSTNSGTPTVLRMSVTPTDVMLQVGQTQQFKATATMTDNSQKDVTAGVQWLVANPLLGAFDTSHPGLFTANAPGKVAIEASLKGAQGTAQVTISPATPTALTIDPPQAQAVKGTTLQLKATGVFPGQVTSDLTSDTMWTSSDPTVATIANDGGHSGLITALSVGQATITATYQSVTATVTLSVVDAQLTGLNLTPKMPSVSKGAVVQLIAAGQFSNQTVQNVSQQVSWSSSDESIVAVSNDEGKRGVAKGVSEGKATVTASLNGVSASVDVTVTAAKVVSVSITPTNPSLIKNATQQFHATAMLGDQTTQDATGIVTWSTSDPTIATISNDPATAGLLTSVNYGTVTVTAAYPSQEPVTTQVTVTSLSLAGIAVLPSTPTVAKGLTLPLSAQATYSDGSTGDVTQDVVWYSSNPAVATVSIAAGSKGVVTALTTGTTQITAGKGIVTSPSIMLTVTAATLTGITVTAASSTVEKGDTMQFKATGKYSDGMSQDITTQVMWSSMDPTIAGIDMMGATIGTVTGLSPGMTQISASMNGVTSAPFPLTVTFNPVTAIAISAPSLATPKGTTVQFTAIGTFADMTTQDITAKVLWASSDTTVAKFSTTTLGLATAAGVGTSSITATYKGVTSPAVTLEVDPAALTAITVSTPSAKVAKGATLQLTATGTYTDGSKVPLTSGLTWTSSSASVATVDGNGLLTGNTAGTVTVTASSGNITSAAVSVQVVALSAIALTPTTVSIPKGLTKQFKASGTYTDGTTQDLSTTVQWASSDQTVATIDANGLATGVGLGSAQISASYAGVTSPAATLTVSTAVLSSVSVSPTMASILAGNTQQFTAMAVYSDGTKVDVTSASGWASSAPTVATVDATGLATGKGTGTANISAIYNGTLSSAGVLSVTGPALQSITVSPALTTLTKGTTQQLTATGTYADSSMADLTTQVTWTSTATSVATITSGGSLKAVGPGTTTITAALNGVTSMGMTISVPTPVLQSIALTPAAFNVAVGGTQAVTAMGSYDDGSTSAITSGITWTVGDMTIATVSASGVVSGQMLGMTTVTAQVGSITSNSAAVTVVQACTLKPVINEVQPGESGHANNEFIELYNPCSTSFDVSGWKLVYHSATGTSDTAIKTIPTSTSIPANGFLVLANSTYTSLTVPTGVTLITYSASIAGAGGGIQLSDSSGKAVDSMGYGTATTANGFTKVAPAPYGGDVSPPHSTSLKMDGVTSGNNSTDFAETSTPTPGALNKITP